MARLINVVFASVERENGFGVTERTEICFHLGPKKKKIKLPLTGNKCKIVMGEEQLRNSKHTIMAFLCAQIKAEFLMCTVYFNKILYTMFYTLIGYSIIMCVLTVKLLLNLCVLFIRSHVTMLFVVKKYSVY